MGQFDPDRAEGFCLLRWMYELVPQQIWTQRRLVARLCVNILDAVILPQLQGLLSGRWVPSLAPQTIETMAQTAQGRVCHCRGLYCRCWVAEGLSHPVGDHAAGRVTDTGEGSELNFPALIAAVDLGHGKKYRFLCGRRV